MVIINKTPSGVFYFVEGECLLWVGSEDFQCLL
jgi:hypothetical protein